MTNVAMGAPDYMAPEQRGNMKDVDQRADIYSLGVVLYEMLTGELPVGNFQRPSELRPVDTRLDEIVLKALAKEPSRRYQQVGHLKTDVEDCATPLPATSPSKPGQFSFAKGCFVAALVVFIPIVLLAFAVIFFFAEPAPTMTYEVFSEELAEAPSAGAIGLMFPLLLLLGIGLAIYFIVRSRKSRKISTTRTTSKMAVWSLVCFFTALLGGGLFVIGLDQAGVWESLIDVGIILAVVSFLASIIFAITGLVSISKNKVALKGKGYAISALSLWGLVGMLTLVSLFVDRAIKESFQDGNIGIPRKFMEEKNSR